jgi:hypothetical protein
MRVAATAITASSARRSDAPVPPPRIFNKMFKEVKSMHPFGAALQARDVELALALLADDVVFRSPVVFERYHGREAVAMLLTAVSRVFEDFRYEHEIGTSQGREHALVFSARIGNRELDGCDLLHIDEHGLIDDLCVMVRPLSGALALAEAMKAELEAAQREPSTQS